MSTPMPSDETLQKYHAQFKELECKVYNRCRVILENVKFEFDEDNLPEYINAEVFQCIDPNDIPYEDTVIQDRILKILIFGYVLRTRWFSVDAIEGERVDSKYVAPKTWLHIITAIIEALFTYRLTGNPMVYKAIISHVHYLEPYFLDENLAITGSAENKIDALNLFAAIYGLTTDCEEALRRESGIHASTLDLCRGIYVFPNKSAFIKERIDALAVPYVMGNNRSFRFTEYLKSFCIINKYMPLLRVPFCSDSDIYFKITENMNANDLPHMKWQFPDKMATTNPISPEHYKDYLYAFVSYEVLAMYNVQPIDVLCYTDYYEGMFEEQRRMYKNTAVAILPKSALDSAKGVYERPLAYEERFDSGGKCDDIKRGYDYVKTHVGDHKDNTYTYMPLSLKMCYHMADAEETIPVKYFVLPTYDFAEIPKATASIDISSLDISYCSACDSSDDSDSDIDITD